MLGQFTTIPNVLFLDNKISRSAVIVYGVLQSHAGVNGKIYPSYETIAREGGISRRTAIYAVKELEQSGYLAKEKGTFKGTNKQASNYYYLNQNPSIFQKKPVDNSDSYSQPSEKIALQI